MKKENITNFLEILISILALLTVLFLPVFKGEHGKLVDGFIGYYQILILLLTIGLIMGNIFSILMKREIFTFILTVIWFNYIIADLLFDSLYLDMKIEVLVVVFEIIIMFFLAARGFYNSLSSRMNLESHIKDDEKIILAYNDGKNMTFFKNYIIVMCLGTVILAIGIYFANRGSAEIFGYICIIGSIAMMIYAFKKMINMGKSEIYITNKRVLGISSEGKTVDMEFGSIISAISVEKEAKVVLTTSIGKIAFYNVPNNQRVCNLLISQINKE